MAKTIKLPITIAKKAATLAQSKKAHDISILDLRKTKNAFADCFVLCSCDSDTQVRAVADAVIAGLKEVGVRAYHVEGQSVGQWVLIDYVDVVVHVMHRAARAFYSLERLWGDGKITRIADEVDTPTEKPKRVRKAK